MSLILSWLLMCGALLKVLLSATWNVSLARNSYLSIFLKFRQTQTICLDFHLCHLKIEDIAVWLFGFNKTYWEGKASYKYFVRITSSPWRYLVWWFPLMQHFHFSYIESLNQMKGKSEVLTDFWVFRTSCPSFDTLNCTLGIQ